MNSISIEEDKKKKNNNNNKNWQKSVRIHTWVCWLCNKACDLRDAQKKKEKETILSKLLLPVVKFTNVCEMFWLVIYIEVYVTVHNCKNKASTKMELTIIMVHKFVTLRLKQKVIVAVLK